MSAVSWDPVSRLIRAAAPTFSAEIDRVRRLVEQSNERLAPLGDPLLTDFGAHRWLRGSREEHYTDWLEWIVGRLEDARQVLSLFGIDARVPTGSPEVQCEFRVPEGHEGCEGRLDLVIRYGSEALICVETKLGSAENADIAKQRGYRAWLDRQIGVPPDGRFAVLVVTESKRDEWEGFRVVRWASLCLRLREAAVSLMRRNEIVVAALVLAFVGAVEQNLLRFPVGAIRLAMSGGRAVLSPAVGDHLMSFLEGDDGGHD